MAALKEIKERILTVGNTHKITAAMKMVASAKLRKAQAVAAQAHVYRNTIDGILEQLVCSCCETTSVYIGKRVLKHASILVISSNSSLCGSFNSNVIRTTEHVYENLKAEGAEEIAFYTLGKKCADAVRRWGFQPIESHPEWVDHPDHRHIAELCIRLMRDFRDKKTDRVELIYTFPQSTAHQIVICEEILPYERLRTDRKNGDKSSDPDYIIEPSAVGLLLRLIPEVVTTICYTALLNSTVSEDASRMIAMQMATDNAEDLLHDLTVSYNSTRQQIITGELSDIMGSGT